MDEITKGLLGWAVRGLVWGLVFTWAHDEVDTPPAKINTQATYNQWLRWKKLDKNRYISPGRYTDIQKENLAAFEAWLKE